ncbi:hypothetical protein SH139x_001372 [Planctomycetaceae bacterium SH139]
MTWKELMTWKEWKERAVADDFTRPLRCLVLLSLLLPLPTPAAMAQFAADGEPATLRISAAAEPIPAIQYTFWPPADRRRQDNAMALYSRAMIAMVQTTHRGDRDDAFYEKYNAWLDGPLAAGEVAEVKEFLGAYQVAFDEFYRAIPLMGVDYPLATEKLTIGQWVSLTLEDVQIAREMARLLSLKAKVAAAEGRWADYTHEMTAIYRLADLVGGSSDLLVTKLVSLAILGIADGLVRDASTVEGAPNFYWALAAVPESIFDVRAALENESLLVRRAIPFDIDFPDTPIGRERSARLWQQIADEVGETIETVSPGSFTSSASVDLLSGIGVLALAEPSRRYLRENTAWGERVSELSNIEAVLRATIHDLNYQTGEYVKWALLPNSIRQRYLSRSEQFLDAQEDSVERMMTPVSILTGLLLPAIQAANTASLRSRRTHFETATIQAIRDHAARTGELPEALNAMELPPWPDPVLGDLDDAGYSYTRETAKTARFNRNVRWPGDQSATLIIQLVK